MQHTAITAAMTEMRLDMPTCDCPCCGDTLDRDDMMGDRMSDEMTIALLDRYGRTICFECADDHRICECCGGAFPGDEITDGECEGCAGTLAAEWKLDAEHERIERAITRI